MAEEASTTAPNEGKAADLIAGVSDASDEELAALLEAERESENSRSTVIDAVEGEIKAREEAGDDDEEDDDPKALRYSRDELLANARSFTGYSRHILAGALHGKRGKDFTIEQATALAKKFSKRKVKSEGDEG